MQLYKQLESCQNVNKELIQSDHDNGEAIKPQQVPVIDTMERLKQSEEMVKVRNICLIVYWMLVLFKQTYIFFSAWHLSIGNYKRLLRKRVWNG